eukprot:659596-Amphidinium_carterae.1
MPSYKPFLTSAYDRVLSAVQGGDANSLQSAHSLWVHWGVISKLHKVSGLCAQHSSQGCWHIGLQFGTHARSTLCDRAFALSASRLANHLLLSSHSGHANQGTLEISISARSCRSSGDGRFKEPHCDHVHLDYSRQEYLNKGASTASTPAVTSWRRSAVVLGQGGLTCYHTNGAALRLESSTSSCFPAHYTVGPGKCLKKDSDYKEK